MNKAVTHSFQGMNQDIRKSSFPNEFYFEGKNIRIIATDSQTTGAVTNEKGNKLIYSVPIPVIDYSDKTINYNNKTLSYATDEINDQLSLKEYNQSGVQYIIGHTVTRQYVILFTSDENGFDCIWKIRLEDYDITLLYIRDMLFSRKHPIQAINNFENKSIDKVYWVDGLHQMRFINIEQSIESEDLEDLIDVSLSTIDMVGKYDVSQPIILRVLSGGIHTAGMIQYAYNLYKVNSSQTRLSPLSQLISLDKDILGGGAVNEVVGSTPVVGINDIDPDYTHIKVYAIKYTSFNESPTISIIDDREIPSSNSIEVFDDGSVQGTISLEEFLFLGSDILIPKHINSKDNRLFLANYEERNYNVDLDVRAYSFSSSKKSFVYDNIRLATESDTINIGGITGEVLEVDQGTFIIPEKFDCINLDYDNYKYQKDGITYGGEGLYLKYELFQSQEVVPDARYFKDEEIYRLGVEFVNGFGQYSLPYWVSDFKSREGNLRGFYNSLIFTLKPDFFVWLNTSSNFETEYDKPVGYRVLIAERTVNDRTIIANGIVSPMMINDKSTRDVNYNSDTHIQYVKDKADQIPKLPNMLLRNVGPTPVLFDAYYGSNTKPLQYSQNLQEMCNKRESPNSEFPRAFIENKETFGRFYQYNAMYQLYSPELIFNESIQVSPGHQFRVKGGLTNTYNAIWGKVFNAAGTIAAEGKGLNGVSLTYADTRTTITGNGELATNGGLICHPVTPTADRVAFTSFYRGYGDTVVNDTFKDSSSLVSFQEDIETTSGNNLPTTPPYPNNIIRFESDNRAIVFTTYQANRYLKLSYTITPTDLLKTYTASLCADSSGENILHSFSGMGASVVELRPSDRMQPFFIGTFKEYSFYLKIETDEEITLDIDIIAEVYDDDEVTNYVSVKSENNSLLTTTSGDVIDNSFFNIPTNKVVYDIYGTPEITVRGQNNTIYNDDSKYKYINTFLDIRGDKDGSFDDDGKYGRAIISGNSEICRCITFVLGNDTSSTPYYERPLIETLFAEAGFEDGVENIGIIGEIVKPREQVYLGNIYGGNSYEDKKRSKYIEIGDFKNLDSASPSNLIISPGDTFVNYFKFQRVIPKTPTIIQEGIPTWQEVVEFYTESTIDMKNRNDASLSTWDSKFHYTDSEFHQYNKVYSQQPNLMSKRDLDFNVKKVDNFDTNIIASKQKSAGEIIDSWTDILQNEVITLDGKFGAINSLPGFNDEIYAIQDKAFAYMSINPRVQVQGNDGLAIELGTGQVLSDYKYITTDSGTLNKWSVVSSPTGIYFYDALNSTFTAFKGNITGLSDLKGLHTFFLNNVALDEVRLDNPLLQKGISSGYDYINNDVLLTFRQSSKPDFTFSFNELVETFTSFYDYLPTMYISKGLFLIAVHPDASKLYRQYAGKYNEFFDVKYKSSITFNSNPASNFDCIFDNVNFKSEVYVDDVDQPDKTLTDIRAYNDYQDSGLVPLTVGRNNNLRRKFRDWNALVPRDGRNRIRAPWIKLQLDFKVEDTDPDYKFVLHPVSIFYTV